MTSEEAIAYFEYIMTIMDDHSDDYQAAKVALSALHQPPAGELLTLSQLWEMVERDGEIVGDAIIVSENGVLSYGILDCRSDDGICAVISASAHWLKEKDYGNGWVAYAYPPVHIDREVWGCPYCNGNVDDRPFLDSKDLYISGDGWLTSDGQDHDFCKIEFCQKCGRPLTEEAWDELEKRLRG